MTKLSRHSHDELASGLTFNFVRALPGRASSPHTQRAYYRWIDTYLVDTAGLEPTRGPLRIVRMESLHVATLQHILTAPQLRAWLGMLVQRGQGKQGVDQARAAVVTLADLLAEAGWLDDYTAAAMSRVRTPRAEDGQRPGRWLSLEEVRLLMAASGDIATSETQAVRNQVVTTILCTMALRRDELASAVWGDLSIQNNRAVLRVHGKGRKVATIDVPRPVLRQLDRWRRMVEPGRLHPPPNSPLVRRIWKGGRISDQGLAVDGIWLIIDKAALHAGLGKVAPHDLRRSVAGALHESGVPVDVISRLLRHSSLSVTEKYLSRLPHANRGGILMSEALGLEDGDDWPGFDYDLR
ncbi:MAG: tyrosine recombinase XerC [Anaerolineae bacterium]